MSELKALVADQSKQIKQAQAQAMQASVLAEMKQESFQSVSQNSWSFGKLSNGLNQMMGKLGSSLGKLTPKRPKTFEEINSPNSPYRNNIKRKTYIGNNSSIIQDLEYDLRMGWIELS